MVMLLGSDRLHNGKAPVERVSPISSVLAYVKTQNQPRGYVKATPDEREQDKRVNHWLAITGLSLV